MRSLSLNCLEPEEPAAAVTLADFHEQMVTLLGVTVGQVRMDEKLSSRKFTMALVIHYYKPISRFSSLIAALGNDWECGEERKNVP